jgi:hypothetical protein
MRAVVRTALAALALAAAIPAAALGSVRPGADRPCKEADQARYERQGFVCVEIRTGTHRLEQIVAAPAYPGRPKSLPVHPK